MRLVNLIRSFADKLILLATSECASAATMLALGCDEVQMGPLSSLSPVDSSLTHQLSPVDKLNNSVPVSLDELWRVLRLWKEAEENKFGPQAHMSTAKKNNQKENLPFGFNGKTKKVSEDKISDQDAENPYKHLFQHIHPLVFGAVDRYSSLSVRICKEILAYHMNDQEKIDDIVNKLNYDYPAHGYPIMFKEAQRLGLPVTELKPEVLDILNKLQLSYNSLTEEKITDYDNTTYHDNSVYSVVEASDIQVCYTQNYDKFYREAERRYITLNDNSGWSKTEWTKSKATGKKTSKFTAQRIAF